MTSINEKMGLPRAGRRSMMKLPKHRAEAVALTSATCPACGRRGVRETVMHQQKRRFCSWCAHTWEAT